MKFLSMVLMVLFSLVYANANAQDGGGVKADKHGVVAKGKKGGKAGITKDGAVAKDHKGKGVEADKKGTRTTDPKK